jgi:uncharacterized membrane protein
VIAIALTLLVLELKVPSLETPTPRGLASALLREWPSFFALVTSFIPVLIMWIHHRSILSLVHKVDGPLLFANGFFLLVVSIVPFPTALVSRYLATPAAGTACTVYAGTFFLGSLAFWGLLVAALRENVRAPHGSEKRRGELRRSYAYGPPLYLLATFTAPFLPWLSMGICTALWVFWAATGLESGEKA